MSQTTKKFDIGIISLREIGMKINTEELHKINPNNLEVSFGMRLCKEKENELILILHTIINLIEEQRKEIFSYSCEHNFHIDHMDDAIECNEDRLIDKVQIMPTLIGIAFSGMRGMVAIRTAGTPLEQYPLPIINPKEFSDYFMKQSNL